MENQIAGVFGVALHGLGIERVEVQHAAQCGRWAEEGECVKNFGFMGKSCELSCGLCALDGAVPESSATILALKPAAAAKASGGKKKPKKKGDEKPKSEAPKAEKAKAEKAKAEKKPKAEKPAKADTADKPKGNDTTPANRT